MNGKTHTTVNRNPEHLSISREIDAGRDRKSILLTRSAVGRPPEPADLDGKMRTVSLVFSVVAFGLMVYGFADILAGSDLSLPGGTAVPLSDMARLRLTPLSLSCMSAGIVLLAALPTVRVIMALWLFMMAHDLFNALVAMVVLLELLASLHFGT